jgi:hypothetical protein
MPGYAHAGFGRGYGRGRGGGFGRGFRGGGWGYRHQYYATGMPGWQRAYDYPYPATPPPPAAGVTEAQELDYLKEQARYFKSVLEDIEGRLKDLQQRARQQQRGEESEEG